MKTGERCAPLKGAESNIRGRSRSSFVRIGPFCVRSEQADSGQIDHAFVLADAHDAVDLGSEALSAVVEEDCQKWVT